MVFGKKIAAHILSQKRGRLAAYNRRFDRAVHLVTGTIDNLGIISQNIAQTMQEIEDYEKGAGLHKRGVGRGQG